MTLCSPCALLVLSLCSPCALPVVAVQVLLDGVPCTVTSTDLNSVTCIPGSHPSPTGSSQAPLYRPGPSGLVLRTWRNVTGPGAGQLGAFSQWPLYPLYPNTTVVRGLWAARGSGHAPAYMRLIDWIFVFVFRGWPHVQ